MKKSTKDSIVVGFALFSMFFGAGNLIFPAFLGNKIGSEFILGIIGFICTGVGLPLLAILACSKGDGTFKTLSSKIGVKFSVIFTAILFIAIGPMLAIPRTAATTFELTINPFFPSISPFIAMAVYFIINLFFVLSSTSIIDAIGKYLTPALIVLLSLVIIKGILVPLGEISTTGATSVLSTSLIEGYQTMDALAALLFAAVITNSLKEKGYDKDKMIPMALRASIIAALGLAFVYGGLTILGAQTTELVSSDISKTSLLLFIAHGILGNIGKTVIAIAMSLACLTTSIGLLTAGSSFFEKVSKGKLPYKINAVIISIISIVIGALGVDNIIKISGPILNILYPVAITLIVTTLLNKYFTNIKAVRLGIYTSLIFAILAEIKVFDLSFIPLANLGFPWLIPTVIMIGIGHFLVKN